MSPGGLHILGPDEVPPSRVEEDGEANAVRVLLVDDDSAIVSALGEALRDDGLEVATASNGREALALLRNGLRPSAIILDLMMPGMDGWDFRQEQRRDPALQNIPVVVLSATGFSGDTIRAQFGDVALLRKPVPYDELLALLGRVGHARSSAAERARRGEPSAA